MKRILSLLLLAGIVVGVAPLFAQTMGSDAAQTNATKKTRRKHRRHHKNHHKGHLRRDPYPAAQ